MCRCLLCAPCSLHECAPVKIDLLKGQQPLNLLPQEACSAQGDSILRNIGWENMFYFPFSPQREVFSPSFFPKDTETYVRSVSLCHPFIIHEGTSLLHTEAGIWNSARGFVSVSYCETQNKQRRAGFWSHLTTIRAPPWHRLSLIHQRVYVLTCKWQIQQWKLHRRKKNAPKRWNTLYNCALKTSFF